MKHQLNMVRSGEADDLSDPPEPDPEGGQDP